MKERLNELFLPIAPLIKIVQKIDTKKINYKSEKKNLVPISWQYLGFENGNSNHYYKCRTNRPHQINIKSRKNYIITIDAAPYHNDTICISANFKIEKQSQGIGYLLLQQRDMKNCLFYNNNMSNNPVILQDSLISCNITGLVTNNAHTIGIGFGFSGSGTMEISNFKITYFHNGSWIPIDISNNHFVLNKDKDIPYSELPITIHSKDTVIFEKNREYFKQVPKPRDFIYDKIKDSLSVFLPLTVFGDNQHTYPESNKEQLNKLLSNLNHISSFNVNILNDRIANVVILWNIFQHFYPYKKYVDIDWNEVLDYGLKHCYTDSTKDTYLMLLRHMTGYFKDAHIYVSGPTDKWYFPSFQCQVVGNKLVITDVLQKNYPLKVGDIITKLNDININVLLDSLINYVSSPTMEVKYRRASLILLIGKKYSEFKIQILRNNRELHTFILERNVNGYDYEYLFQKDNKPYYQKIKDSIFYINFTTIPADTLNYLLPTLQHFKSIIADFRGYPTIPTDIWIPHLIDKKLTIPNIFFPEEIIYPNQYKSKLMSYSDRTFIPQKPKLNANIVYLINKDAMSAAETFLYYLKYIKSSTFIGQRTTGTTGTVTGFDLPGVYSISFTGMMVKEPNGDLFQSIMPDIKVTPTIEGIKQGKDEILEEAIRKIINND